jgi:hypothetical protein
MRQATYRKIKSEFKMPKVSGGPGSSAGGGTVGDEEVIQSMDFENQNFQKMLRSSS